MLDKNTFIQGLAYIGKSYLRWDFDFQNMDIVEHWYSFFQSFDNVEFKTMIKEYCISETFAPNSVATLLNFWKSQKLEKELLPHAAWEMIVDLISNYGFAHKDKIYNELLEYPVLRKTFWEFETSLRNLKSGDNYMAQRFQEAYKENLKRNVNQVQQQQFKKVLAPKNQKLIAKGGNDNECN